MPHPVPPADGNYSCPLPSLGKQDCITLAHGDGGRLTRRLLRERILPGLRNSFLDELGDSAALPTPTGRLALTIDGYVVTPLFFPGGDIGKLAVFGSVNDLAVAGARPLWLTLGLIIEEGLPFVTLERVIESISMAARRAGVSVVAGDTKVVPRGAADQLFVTVSGVGEILEPAPSGPSTLRPDDALLVSGPIGQHGVAVLVAREGLAFEPTPFSDSAPLFDAVQALRNAGITIRSLRDATRGGLAAVLHEWAEASAMTLAVDESQLPISEEVRSVCELLGLDPIHIAGEGVMVIAVPAEQAADALRALHSVAESRQARQIGTVRSQAIAPVVISRGLGRELPLDEPLAAGLPRIC